MKQKRKRILCKIRIGACNWTFYRDGTYKTQFFQIGDFKEWILGHCEFGPMFIYKTSDDQWMTRWKSNDMNEVKIAETIAKALTDLEMDKILRSKG